MEFLYHALVNTHAYYMVIRAITCSTRLIATQPCGGTVVSVNYRVAIYYIDIVSLQQYNSATWITWHLAVIL